MTRSTVFKTNRSQAVPLPKAVTLPEGVRKVEITAIGASRLISPAGQSWDAFFAGAAVSDDFLSDRQQPKTEQRDRF